MSKKNRISRILSLTLIFMMAFSFLPTGLQSSEVQADTDPYPIEISQTRADEMAKNFFFSNTTATYTKMPHSDYGIKSWSVKVKERPDTRYSLIYGGIAKVDSPQYGGRGWWDLRPGRRYYLYEQKATYSTGGGNGYYVLIDTRTGELHPTGDMWPPISDILSPIEDSTVSGITNKEYTGRAIKQNIVVKHKGSTLRQNVDYTLKYKNNVKIGTATVEVYGIGKYAGKITRTFKITEKQVPLPKNAVRIYGNSRYETANKITEQVKKLNGGKRFSSIIIATGTNYPDALAGSYLAKRKNAPILITSPAEETNVVDYVKKNLTSGGTVYILGGVGAVPNSFVRKLNSAGLKYKRLGGASRYETNLKILDESGSFGNELIVVTGKNFPDALSASAAGRPILLVGDALTSAQRSFLRNNKFSKITIIGGTGAVSSSVSNDLSNYGTTTRVSGRSRYETSAKVAKKYFGSTRNVVLAIGTNYPDALTGGPLALKLKAPMILTSSLAKDYAYANSYYHSAGATQIRVLGGPSLISNKAVVEIIKKQAAPSWAGIWKSSSGETITISGVSQTEFTMTYKSLTARGDSFVTNTYTMTFDSAKKTATAKSMQSDLGWAYSVSLKNGKLILSSRYPDKTFTKTN